MSSRRALLLLSGALWFGAGALVGVAVVHADSEGDDMRLDSDGDGIADAEEDKNHNHQVDHGETDPHEADTDGDGMDDGDEARGGGGAGQTAAVGVREKGTARFLIREVVFVAGAGAEVFGHAGFVEGGEGGD